MSQQPLDENPLNPAVSDPDAELDAAMSTRAKVLTGVLAIAVVAGAGWLMLRVSSPPIAPGQKPPSGHYSLSCAFCHPVSSGAEAEVVR